MGKGEMTLYREMWERYGYKEPNDSWKNLGAFKYPPETECFAYDKGCKALKKLYCRHERCRFFKTTQQYQRGLFIYGGNMG